MQTFLSLSISNSTIIFNCTFSDIGKRDIFEFSKNLDLTSNECMNAGGNPEHKIKLVSIHQRKVAIQKPIRACKNKTKRLNIFIEKKVGKGQCKSQGSH